MVVKGFSLRVFILVGWSVTFRRWLRQKFCHVSLNIIAPGFSELMFFSVLNDSPDLVGSFCVWLSKTKAPQLQRNALAGRFLSCKWDVSELETRYHEIIEKDMLKFRVAID